MVKAGEYRDVAAEEEESKQRRKERKREKSSAQTTLLLMCVLFLSNLFAGSALGLLIHPSHTRSHVPSGALADVT